MPITVLQEHISVIESICKLKFSKSFYYEAYIFGLNQDTEIVRKEARPLPYPIKAQDQATTIRKENTWPRPEEKKILLFFIFIFNFNPNIDCEPDANQSNLLLVILAW